MEYLITYGIKPTPAGTKWRPFYGARRAFHFEELKIGGSMFVPCTNYLQERSVRNAAYFHNAYARKAPGKLTTRLGFDKVKDTWGIWVHCVRK